MENKTQVVNKIQNQKVKFPLSLKLILVLISIPVVSLSAYLYMTLNLFIEDKISYVYDAALQISEATSKQVALNLKYLDKILLPIKNGVDFKSETYDSNARNLFLAQNNVEYSFLYKAEKDGKFSLKDSMAVFPREVKEFKMDEKLFLSLIASSNKSHFSILEYSQKYFFYVVQKMEATTNSDIYYVVSICKLLDLYEAFAMPGTYKKFLINKNKQIVMTPKYWRTSDSDLKDVEFDFFEAVVKQPFPEGVIESKSKKTTNTLIAFSQLHGTDLYVTAVVDKNRALTAINEVIQKSILFGLGVVFIVILLGYLFSKTLTRSIKKLMLITQKIAEGQFKQNIKINSNDEVGVLANNIQWMALEVEQLMTRKTEQARLENELKTVNLIQEKLFPEKKMRLKEAQICSFIEPATECGGDWFHYIVIENKLHLWIGDATGHGAGAAIVTAACKSVSSVIEGMGNMTPADALKILNQAISNTTKGSINMTLFYAQLDLSTGKIIYSNASHEFPIIIPQLEKVTKKDIRMLLGKTSPRLGQDRNTTYINHEDQVHAGDVLVFYTDGIFDLINKEGKKFGDSQFLRLLQKQCPLKTPVESKVNEIKANLFKYRGDIKLEDDLTFFLCEYSP